MHQQLEFQIDSSAILNYKRLDYSFWFAIAEYVDNSTQSYLNNKEITNGYPVMENRTFGDMVKIMIKEQLKTKE